MRLLSLAVAVCATLSLFSPPAPCATYYVDFGAGADTNVGTSPDAPFKHAPGDPAATASAKQVQLAAGDTVVFKGGVVYFGSISISWSGAKGVPIVFDGNTAGTFGTGKAVIDGSTPVSDWKRCASPDEAKGNVRWKEIFYADIPKPADWRGVNLCDTDSPLQIAQEPDPSDPMFQENVREFFLVNRKMENSFPGTVSFEPGTRGNSQTPLMGIIAGQPPVIEPITGGAFSITLNEPATIAAIGIRPQPNYAAVKEFAFLADGKELLRATLEKDKREMQRFDLPSAVTARKLTYKLLSAYEGETNNWTKIARVAAWTPGGKNVLDADVSSVIRDETNLVQSDPRYYDGMWVGVHGGNNIVAYQQVKSFDPAARQLFLTYFDGRLYNETRYALYNSVRLIDTPGEYSVEPTENPRVWRVYLLPDRLVDGKPDGIAFSTRETGIALVNASHIVVRGFTVRRQGGRNASGIRVQDGEDVIIKDCEVTLVGGSGAGISAVGTKNIFVDTCFVHHCTVHSRGIVLRNCTDAITKNCRLVKNTSTALDYYGCTGGAVSGCTVLDHRGMHANGLTFYLGCKNIVVERNYVARGNVGLTIQEAENVTIRNNILDGGGTTTCLGIWPGQPIKNLSILHNTLVRSNHAVEWQTGLFTNSSKFDGLVVRNNIIDGLCGTPPFPKEAVFTHNLYTRLGPDRKDKSFGEGEFYEPDLTKIFVNPEAGDFRLKTGSPAVDAGTALDVPDDFDGTKRPQGRAPDIGAYELRSP